MHLPRGVSEVTFFNLIAHTLLSKLWTGVRHSRSFLEIATACILSDVHMSIYALYVYIVYVVYFPGDGSGRLHKRSHCIDIHMCLYMYYIYIAYVVNFPGDGSGRLAGGATAYP